MKSRLSDEKPSELQSIRANSYDVTKHVKGITAFSSSKDLLQSKLEAESKKQAGFPIQPLQMQNGGLRRLHTNIEPKKASQLYIPELGTKGCGSKESEKSRRRRETVSYNHEKRPSSKHGRS